MVGTKTALLVNDYDMPVQVHGYDEGVGEIEACRTVSAVTAYDHPESEDTYMLVLHQTILIPQMENNLLRPLQIRDNDVRVNDELKFMALTPTENHHAIVINGIDQDQQPINIPLSIRGVISYFPSRKPTREEYEVSDPDLRIKMTVEDPEWDSRTTWFESQEESMTDSSGKLIDRPVKWGNERIIATLYTLPQGEQPATDFGLALARTVNTPTPRIASKGKDPVSVKVLNTSSRRNSMSPQLLAQRWGTHVETAKRTLDATTQRGVRSILNPTMRLT